MAIDPKTTAIVLIEYQNDFTSEGGVLHGAVEEVMDKTNMLANTKRVVDAARAAGVTVMHVPITFAKGYGEQHDNAIAYDFPMFSQPTKSGDFIGELR